MDGDQGASSLNSSTRSNEKIGSERRQSDGAEIETGADVGAPVPATPKRVGHVVSA